MKIYQSALASWDELSPAHLCEQASLYVILKGAGLTQQRAGMLPLSILALCLVMGKFRMSIRKLWKVSTDMCGQTPRIGVIPIYQDV